MSEFRVVKCKKCDASLIEMEGEKLSRCIQCGYSFNLVDSKNKNPHAITRKIKNSPDYKRYLKKIRSKTNSPAEPVTEPAIGNNKKPIWLTMLKWYFVISIFIGMLSGLFR